MIGIILEVIQPHPFKIEVKLADIGGPSAGLMFALGILDKLNGLPAGQQVMLKLTLPEQADFYAEFVRHPKVVRVVALSGGYTREEADDRLRKNHGVVASFSRALLDGLSVHQTDAEFNALLDASIRSIYEASIT